jgi:hypothetical protein
MNQNTLLILGISILVVFISMRTSATTQPKPRRKPRRQAGGSCGCAPVKMAVIEPQEFYPLDSGYNEYLEGSIDQDIIDSHRTFVAESGDRTTGPSTLSVLDHETNINPVVGLRQVNYAAIKIDETARTVPSQFAQQLNSHNPSTYSFNY